MKFLKRAAALTLALSASVSLLACSNAKTPTQGWKVVAVKDYTQAVSFNVTRNSKDIDEVWFNVGKLATEEVTITFSTTSSSFSPSTSNQKSFTVTRDILKTAKKENNGWIKVVEDWGVSNSYVRFDLDGGITLNEIAFRDEDGKQLTATVDKAKIYVKDGSPSATTEYFTSEELATMTSTDGMPANLLDEQEKFKV